MVHSQAKPKRRRAAPYAPPAGVRRVEADGAGSGDGIDDPAHKRVKPVHPSPRPPQKMCSDIISEPPPLGLRLRKSASFLNLIESILSKGGSTTEQPVMENTISTPPATTTKPFSPRQSLSSPHVKKNIKSGALATGERLKASNFPGNFLKIGNWEYTSRYEGDLVAKCYYAKQKLVWEVLDAGFKSKIELQWSHISALKATCPEEGDGILDLVLSRPPMFFQETDPQPRKHTLWQVVPDFTGGQASMYRRHILRCSSSLLSRNFEKLIQCDQRLYQLSQQPVVILDSPIFENSSIFENPNESDDPSHKFTHLASPYVVSSVFENGGMKPLMLKQPKCFSRAMNLGVVASNVRENFVAQEQKKPNLFNMAVPGLRSSMSVGDLLNHIDNYIVDHQAVGEPPVPNNEVSSKELFDIRERLLSDTHGPPSADEECLMARVDSFCCLLEKDNAPATISNAKHSGAIDGTEVDSDDFDGRSADGVVPPVILRNDSFADLREDPPRISSVSQFLFDLAEDLENSSSHSQG